MYNAQTPVGMFPNRADMPAETPAAYPPHERTGKTAFSKLWDMLLGYTPGLRVVFQNWINTGLSIQPMRLTGLDWW